MTQIIVGLDESTGAAAALRWAVREAPFLGGTVTAVFAWNLVDARQLHDTKQFDPEQNEEVARQRVVAAVGEEAAATIDCLVVNDLPDRALVEQSGKADLLVVGARGRGGFKSLLLGSVSSHCLDHAACPVVVVRSDADVHDPERIVVGIDGSLASQAALDSALAVARAHDAVVELVHAWQPPIVGGPFAMSAYDWTAIQAAAEELLDRIATTTDTSGVRVERHVACGNPAGALVDAARDADLVVVGFQGRHGMGRVIGSTAQQVAHHVTCPVAVIPCLPDAG
jgi:nucleotide-binding universal stress UspA family protein